MSDTPFSDSTSSTADVVTAVNFTGTTLTLTKQAGDDLTTTISSSPQVVTGLPYNVENDDKLKLTQSAGQSSIEVTIPSSSTLPFEHIQTTTATELTGDSSSGTGLYPGADITLLTKSITPTSASQKILVTAQVNGCSATSAFRGNLIIRRSVSGESDVYLAPAVDGLRTSCTGAFANSHQTTTSRIDQTSVLFIDAPGTTSAVTYTPSVFNSQTGFSFFLNSGAANDGNFASRQLTPSTMTLRCF